MTAQFTRKPLDYGFSQIPHGLWTLDVTPGARCLLGWLHSHTDQFLASVTVNMIRRVFNTSSAAKWLGELADAGFIAVTKGGTGKADSYELLTEPWMDLHQRRRHRAETGLVAGTTEPKPAHHRAETGAPNPARVEDQSEDTRENTTSPIAPKGASHRRRRPREPITRDDDPDFIAFWEAFGKHGVRRDARWSWDVAVTLDTVDNIVAGAERWRKHREAGGVTKYAQGWLTSETWKDTPPKVTVDKPAVQPRSQIERVRARMAAGGTGPGDQT